MPPELRELEKRLDEKHGLARQGFYFLLGGVFIAIGAAGGVGYELGRNSVPETPQRAGELVADVEKLRKEVEALAQSVKAAPGPAEPVTKVEKKVSDLRNQTQAGFTAVGQAIADLQVRITKLEEAAKRGPDVPSKTEP